MPWRFLVDEDTDAASAGELVDRGFDAVTVASSLGRGESDHAVGAFARSENRILVTTDRDFLDPTLRGDVRVLLVADGSASGREIATRAAELAQSADGPSDLRPVTWL